LPEEDYRRVDCRDNLAEDGNYRSLYKGHSNRDQSQHHGMLDHGHSLLLFTNRFSSASLKKVGAELTDWSFALIAIIQKTRSPCCHIQVTVC
jgi:hypothetical protein